MDGVSVNRKHWLVHGVWPLASASFHVVDIELNFHKTCCRCSYISFHQKCFVRLTLSNRFPIQILIPSSGNLNPFTFPYHSPQCHFAFSRTLAEIRNSTRTVCREIPQRVLRTTHQHLRTLELSRNIQLRLASLLRLANCIPSFAPVRTLTGAKCDFFCLPFRSKQ